MKRLRRGRVHHFDHTKRLSLASLLTLVGLIPLSGAQDVTESLQLSGTALSTSTANTLTATPVSTDQTTLLVIHSTASAATTGTPTEAAPRQIHPTATGTNGQPLHDNDTNVFNYYFLFLAAFGILAAGLLRWIHVRRKRQKQQQRLSGQHALARDLEGWAGARRFMHGRYGRYQTARVRREEGLDEDGEAPPPYQPKSEVTVAVVSEQRGGPAVPLRTLARDEHDRVRPPGYTVTARTDES